jgi:hypothetical protein
MEYTIGFKIKNTNVFYIHSIVLTKDKKIGIIDYAPNRNAEILKVRFSLEDSNYYTYNREDLETVEPFMTNADCKEFTILNCDNYLAFKLKGERFKEEDLTFEDDETIFVIPNEKNYTNPNIEQSIKYLENTYMFSSTGEAYHINNVIRELKRLKYGIDEEEDEEEE